ncbi:TonB-dependent receptor [Temperatibacter marinus]|uniref:TonB-dependent receptor n=1 Tax=Temperatibacter marinus TaxID=1456591 RepID=A0AA52EF73_9PROT|nr:TonB-dependent receptor [Temperatibacter marinus]WND03630.1 TonB-dependent receptor [Temperatibacter marinus]
MSLFKGAISWFTVPVLSLSEPVTAVDSVDAGDDVEEIVVTARKREEAINKIPSALTQIDADAIKNAGAVSLKDIAGLIPNLTTTNGQGMGATTALFIRGIGQNDSLQTFEQGVTTYVDGVPYPRMQGLFLQLFDVDSIEVLRGPQGTLFGKNAVGGAVNITTKSAGDKLEGELEALIGEASHKQISAFLSAPMSDRIGMSASLFYSHRDGFYQDIKTGKDYSDDDSFTARVKMDIQASEALSIRLAADLTDMELAPPGQRAEDDVFITDLVFGTVLAQAAPTQEFDGRLELSIDDDANETFNQKGLAATIDWTMTDQWQLRSVTAYKEMTSTINWDLDGTALVIADVMARWDQDQFSEEINLNYKGDQLDAVFGLYYLTEESAGRQFSDLKDLVQVAGTSFGLSQPGEDVHKTSSYAAFAHLSYSVSDHLSMEAGLRWSRDEKSFYRVSTQQLNGVVTGQFTFNGSDNWNSLTPSVALSYQVNDKVTFYSRIAKGFRSGGFNGRLSSLGDSEPYKPENVWSYESGLKYVAPNIRMNMAAFYNDYTDFQARISRLADLTDPTVGFDNPTVNAADLKIYGLEGDVTATLGPLSLIFTGGYLHSEYGEFVDDSGDRSSNTPVFSPKLTVGITASYKMDLAQGRTVSFSGSLKHRSGYFASVENTDKLYQPAYQHINIGVEWQSTNGLYIRAGIRNVTDKIVLQGGLEFRSLGNIQTGYYGAPRTWYSAVGYKF